MMSSKMSGTRTYGPSQVRDLSVPSGLSAASPTVCHTRHIVRQPSSPDCVYRKNKGSSCIRHLPRDTPSPSQLSSLIGGLLRYTLEQQRQRCCSVIGNTLGRGEGFNSPCCSLGNWSHSQFINKLDLAVRHSRHKEMLCSQTGNNYGT